jgi:molecular chaperone GrpE
MTRKKQGKTGNTDKVNISEATDNKGIDSQDNRKVKNIEDSDVVISQSSEVNEETQLVEADTDNISDKDASQVVLPEVKLAEMQDRYLRLSAEFDNYRKRTLREKIELTKNAGENLLFTLIPVMDDFERALKLMEPSTDCASMKNGIDLIYNKFRDFLRLNGIREINALNNEFNVDLHEAVNKVPVEDESMKGKVVEVVEKGYYLYDKVLRFSKVIVGE